MISKDVLKKAQQAWVRTGRPYGNVEKMGDKEIRELAKLTAADGNAVEGFAEKFSAWWDDYLEGNKATTDALELPQQDGA